MTRADESQETIARIRMEINADAESRRREAEELTESRLEPLAAEKNWCLGSRTKPTNPVLVERDNLKNPVFKNFNTKFKKFCADHLGYVAPEGTIIRVSFSS